MASDKFRLLIEGFCSLGKINEADKIIKGGPFAVNGVVFSLIYSEQKSLKDMFFAYCDFGTPAKGREAEVYRALMETNLLLYPLSGPMFSISPQTARVVLVNRYSLLQLAPKTLGDILAHLAEKAKDWRTHQYLDTALPVRTKSSAEQLLREFRP